MVGGKVEIRGVVDRWVVAEVSGNVMDLWKFLGKRLFVISVNCADEHTRLTVLELEALKLDL